MVQARRTRPEKHTVLHSFGAHVTARPAAVFAALDARFRSQLDSFAAYTADPVAFLIIAQGRWWYRGEYRIVPDDTGSHVEFVIVNVARRARVLSTIAARRALTGAPDEFETLIRRLRLELE